MGLPGPNLITGANPHLDRKLESWSSDTLKSAFSGLMAGDPYGSTDCDELSWTTTENGVALSMALNQAYTTLHDFVHSRRFPVCSLQLQICVRSYIFFAESVGEMMRRVSTVKRRGG